MFVYLTFQSLLLWMNGEKLPLGNHSNQMPDTSLWLLQKQRGVARQCLKTCFSQTTQERTEDLMVNMVNIN